MRSALYRLQQTGGLVQKKKKKTDSLCVPHCKMYINSIAWTKVLFFGATKERISIFVP